MKGRSDFSANKYALLLLAALGAVAFYFYKVSRFDAEEAPSIVRRKDGRFEVRRYPTLTIARTSMRDGHDQSFRRLFKFISGENERAEKLPMTTPVLFEGEPGQQNSMSFIMRAKGQTGDAPQPRSSRVKLDQHASGEVAVVRFSGGMDEARERRAVRELRAWMEENHLKPEGEPIIAYYDSPMLPGPLRRNEALLGIASSPDQS